MKRALIVGIDDYPDHALSGCVADAVTIAELLRTNGDGSPNFSVQRLTSDEKLVDRPQLRRSLKTLFAGPCDTALLYFAGHGMIDSTGGFVVTSDATAYDEGVAMDWMLTLANKSQATNKIIILDCCHSGAFGNMTSVDSPASAIGPGVSVLSASRDSESALEVGGQGVFTSLLADALSGGAADLRGNVTPGSLYAYVDEALGAWDQRPIFKTNVSSFAVIRTVNPKVSFDKLRQITELFEEPAAEHQLDPSYEYTDESADETKVVKFKILQEYVAAGLVVPVGEEHMYFAAMNSKSCRLTAIGGQYWRLVSEGRL